LFVKTLHAFEIAFGVQLVVVEVENGTDLLIIIDLDFDEPCEN
jgi:hypothetical protein